MTQRLTGKENKNLFHTRPKGEKIARAKNSGGAAGGLPAMLRKAIAGGGRRAGTNQMKFDIFCKRVATMDKLELLPRGFAARHGIERGFDEVTMKSSKGKLKICSRGHKFYKSSDCPMCPICWSGYYREKHKGDFPNKLAVSALQALLNVKIYNLSQLAKYSEQEILELHGMGQNAIKTLRSALKFKKLSFKK